MRVQGVDADFEVVQLLHQRGKVFGLDAVARHSRVDVDGHFESRAVLRKGGIIYLFYLINLFLLFFIFCFIYYHFLFILYIFMYFLRA